MYQFPPQRYVQSPLHKTNQPVASQIAWINVYSYQKSSQLLLFLLLNVSVDDVALGENNLQWYFFACSHTSVILFQWRVIIALLVMSSSRGQHSLNSSIVFLRSRKACHSFRAWGSLRHLVVKVCNSQKAHCEKLYTWNKFCTKQIMFRYVYPSKTHKQQPFCPLTPAQSNL